MAAFPELYPRTIMHSGPHLSNGRAISLRREYSGISGEERRYALLPAENIAEKQLPEKGSYFSEAYSKLAVGSVR